MQSNTGHGLTHGEGGEMANNGKLIGIAGGVISTWVKVGRKWEWIGHYASDTDAMTAATRFLAKGGR